MTSIRPIPLAVAGLIAASATGAGAHSSPCGASYEVRPSDTLCSIAQQCRVTLSSIMDLNPSVDPRSLSVGEDIRLEA